MTSDEMDKRTESLNQSGVFLQMCVANQLKSKWDTWFEYPVRTSPFLDPLSKHLPSLTHDTDCFDASIFVDAVRQSMSKETVKETSIDIVAGKHISCIGNFNLCIESKKLHSDDADWVFFQKSAPDNFRCLVRGRPNRDTPVAELLKTSGIDGRFDTLLGIRYMSQGYFNHTICDFGISLKEKLVEEEYYKSNKSKVDQAARQIIEETYGFVIDTIIQHILSGEPVLSEESADIFIPIIVTNANLSICEFDEENIDSETGKITKNPHYAQVNSLIYECPVPKTVQFPEPLEGPISPTQNAAIIKWHVLVFTSKGFSKFLNAIKSVN